MTESIEDGKYVELKYKVIDVKTDSVLTEVEFPRGYVHGVSQVLSPMVMQQLDGRVVGDVIEVPIDCNELYGPRDESLVVTDYIENVPEEYREIGTAILMENRKGETKSFIVTRMEGSVITFDGNNPLCGREVLFVLEILEVRDATEEEIEFGGKVEEEMPDVPGTVKVPVQ